MARPSRIRRGVLGSLLAAAAGLGGLVAAGAAAPAGDLPDLTAMLPGERAGSPNARWVDTSEVPGRTLYRFDTVIMNRGAGALEVFRDPAGATFQRTWSGGVPGGAATSKSFPPGTSSGDRAIPLGGPGQQNALRYSAAVGHEHFHAQRVAAYELQTTGGARVAESAKNVAGFCMFDSWGDESTRASFYPTDGTSCARGEASYAGLLRMGISPGWGDLYASQIWDQWVDVTGVAPGTYRLVGIADPDDLYEESNEANNASPPVTVVVPGVIAAPRTAATPPGRAVDIPLSGDVVGASVRSRLSKECDTRLASCMTTAAAGPASYAVAPPTTGTVALTGSRVRYTPPRGFRGAVSFRYTATDSRGLTSAPARVTVRVTPSARTAGGIRPRPRAVGLSVAKLRPRGPFMRFVAAGAVRPPARMARACAGRVRVRVVVGRKVVRTVTAKLRRHRGVCRYRVVVAVPRSKLGRARTVKVAARYLGSTRLKPKSARVRTVRLP
jgi:hypothetical protein